MWSRRSRKLPDAKDRKVLKTDVVLYLDVLYASTTIASRQLTRNTSSTASQNRQLQQNGGHQLATSKTVPKRRSIVTKGGSHLQPLRGYHADSSPEPSAPPAARQRLQLHRQLPRAIPTLHKRQSGSNVACHSIWTSPTQQHPWWTSADPRSARGHDLRRLQGSCESDKS